MIKKSCSLHSNSIKGVKGIQPMPGRFKEKGAISLIFIFEMQSEPMFQ